MEILPYTPALKQTILDIFQANVPEHFAQEEITQLSEYLDKWVEDFFVVQGEGNIVGAAGINYNKEKDYAVLSWAAIHPTHQNKGYGSFITKHRIQHIKQNTSFSTIIVRTSQTAFEFYQIMGFTLQYTKKDYWAPGFDLYFMDQHLKR
jgi:ribosomal-protein-alanine N-acetyltransferase